VREKWKALLAQYGKVAIGVYLSIFLLVFAGFAIAIQLGFAVDDAAGGAGTVGAAWVATKLTQPIRILATVALTPLVAAVINRFFKRSSEPTP
jgi:hypothetical protein